MTANEVPAMDAIPVVMSCVFLFIGLSVFILQVVVFCMIYSKAGYSWAMGLLMLIPIVNFIMMLILAFSEWPIQRQLKQFQQHPVSQPPVHENFRNL